MPASLNESVALPSDCFLPLVARKSACLSTIPCRRSERILLMEAAKKGSEGLKSINCLVPPMEMNITSMQCPQGHLGANLKRSTGATLSLDGNNKIPSSGNDQNGKQKRGRPKKMRPEERSNANAQRNSVCCNSLMISKGETSKVSTENAVAREGPTICPLWRGSFTTEKFGLLDGLAAHASKNASEEVRSLASHLPAQLHLQIVPILDACPGFFSIPNPNIGMVDLNIFPENDRSQREFDNLLSSLLKEGLAMKTSLKDIVILIFTSHQLPYEYWRAGGKYYLRAVFSEKNAFFPGSKEANELHRDSTVSRNACTADYSNLDKREQQKGKEVMKPRNVEMQMKSSDQALDNPMIIAGTISSNPTAAGETSTKRCLPLVLLKPSPQQRTSPSEERRNGASEKQLQPTHGFQRGGFSPERIGDRMRPSTTEVVGSETIGASVFHMFHNFDDVDLEGINSTYNSVAPIQLYSVKPSLVSTLTAIIEKHGDIAQDCTQTSGEMLKHVLERVCQEVKDLGELPFNRLQSSDLKSLDSTISDAELINLNVKWLRDRYDELLETVSGIRKYSRMKADIKEQTAMVQHKQRVVESKRTKMLKLQSEVESLDSEVASMTTKIEGLKKTRNSVKAKFRYFRHNSLVNGLL